MIPARPLLTCESATLTPSSVSRSIWWPNPEWAIPKSIRKGGQKLKCTQHLSEDCQNQAKKADQGRLLSTSSGQPLPGSHICFRPSAAQRPLEHGDYHYSLYTDAYNLLSLLDFTSWFFPLLCCSALKNDKIWGFLFSDNLLRINPKTFPAFILIWSVTISLCHLHTQGQEKAWVRRELEPECLASLHDPLGHLC